MRSPIQGLILRLLVLILVSLHCASAAFAQTWQEWSDTDISRFWNVPAMASSRTRVSTSPMGSASYVIPVELPPSRYSPSLSISYHAQGGDDEHLGLGWALDIPVIRKNPTPDLPAYEKIVGPDGPLVQVAGLSPLVGDFRPREDHTGARHLYRAEQLGRRWRVTGKTGEEWVYEDLTSHILFDRWVLKQQKNAFGDTIDYAYTDDGRIDTISYGGNADGEDAEFTVNFEYEPRACIRTDYRFGGRIAHEERVHLIQVKVGTTVVRRVRLDYEDCPDRLAQVVDLAFNGQAFGNSRTLAFEYGEPGWISDNSWELPEYFDSTLTESELRGAVRYTSSYGVQVVGSANGDPLPDLIGTSSVAHVQRAELGQDHRFEGGLQHPAGSLELGGTESRAEATLLERWSREVAEDIDGDGFMDAATVTEEGDVRVVWGGFNGLDRESNFRHPFPAGASTGPVFTWSDRRLIGGSTIGSSGDVLAQTVALLDFDGDGDRDLVRFAGYSGPGVRGGRLEVYSWERNLGQWSDTADRYAMPWCDDFASVLNDDGKLTFGQAGICPLTYATHETPAGAPSSTIGGQRAGMIDMNGDGRVDFAVATADGWHVYIGTPAGFVNGGMWAGGPPVMMRHYGSYNVGFQTSVMMVDVDGDGLTDVVDTLANASLEVPPELWGVWWQNTGDSGAGFIEHSLDSFIPPAFTGGVSEGVDCDAIRGCASTESFATVAMADWNGDGTTDILDAENGIAWLGQNAYLLSAVDHESGSTFLDWSGAGDAFPSGAYPSVIEQQHLAFPTLRSATELDAVVNRTSTVSYEYHRGHVDPDTRGFTAFGREIASDSLGRRTETQRYDRYPFTGLVYSRRYGPLDREHVTITTIHEEVMERLGGPLGAAVVRATSETATEREFNGDIGTSPRQRSSTFTYGPTANLESVQLHGSSERPPPFDEVRYEVRWATPGIRGLEAPCTMTVRGGIRQLDGQLRRVQERRLFYLGEAHCQAGRGDISRIEVDRTGPGVSPETRTWDIGRNTYGQVTDTSAPSGASTDFFYDSQSRYVNLTVDPLNFITTRTEDVWGNETFRATPDQVSTRTTWDGWHRTRSVVHQSPTVSPFLLSETTYVDGALPTSNTVTYNDDGSVDSDLFQVLDGSGQVVQTRRAVPTGDLVFDVEYAPDGQVERSRVPYITTDPNYTGYQSGPATVNTYDAIGRWETTTDLMGGVAKNITDDPWITTTRDPEEFETHRERDGLGRERFVWSSNAFGGLAPSEFEYDTLGRVIAVTDPDGIVTTYEWSSLGELLRVESPDFGFRTFTYDADSRLTDIRDAAGRHVQYDLDDLGRMLLVREEQDDSGLITVETYTWDTLVPGKLTSVVDRAGTVAYTYDGLSRVSSETRTFPDSKSATRTMSYDHQGRLANERHPDGVQQSWRYADGRLVEQTAKLADSRVLSLKPTYDQRGRFRGIGRDGWRLSLALDLDDLDRVTSMTWGLGGLPQGAPDLQVVHRYHFLRNGLIKRRAVRNAPEDSTYRYDAGGRIRAALGRGAAGWSLTAGGLPLARTGLDAKNYVEVDATHQLDEVRDPAYPSDPKAPRWIYSWDESGNVRQIDRHEGTKIRETLVLSYDGLGRPTEASNGKGTLSRRFAWDGSIPYEVVDNKVIKRLGTWESVAGTDRTLLVVGGIQLGRVQDGRKLIATMVDMHGTPTNVVNEAGETKSTLELDPYGVSIATTGNPDVADDWLGVPRSSKLGLVSTGARLFDERSRTFLQPEPMALADAGPAYAKDPYQSNPFSYSRWNGLNLKDANGREPASANAVVFPYPTETMAFRRGHLGWEQDATDDAVRFAAAATGGRPFPSSLAAPEMLTQAERTLLARTAVSGRESGAIYYVTSDGREGVIDAGFGTGRSMGQETWNAEKAVPSNAIYVVGVHAHPAPGSAIPSASDVKGTFLHGATLVVGARGGPSGGAGSTLIINSTPRISNGHLQDQIAPGRGPSYVAYSNTTPAQAFRMLGSYASYYEMGLYRGNLGESWQAVEQ